MKADGVGRTYCTVKGCDGSDCSGKRGHKRSWVRVTRSVSQVPCPECGFPNVFWTDITCRRCRCTRCRADIPNPYAEEMMRRTSDG